ncbi:conserved hypothetical protein [Neospora caninum Liverpool]|uniref:Trichohyalin n=1 Tax=Neospora caninum (strain Liverpool) TaxID=572307 RepID=F0VDC5_NEOCL|nr:conserved hypothetical protein [Neospora caninum Liverpool]CBZ51640.1 conserved hypothetical protein [Neospora caninum Liverpool]CEL65594.1 TPA: hypothetical protein BN1204_014340 [Neospora caninum Liverpool]|eukprot:XP_003881673.1 conserved hypothetical protein [Neospora caninum Liverpool]
MTETASVSRIIEGAPGALARRGKRAKNWQQDYYATLLSKTVDLLDRFQPTAHTVETFAEEFLKTEKAEDAAFVAGTFYGVLTKAPFLTAAATALVQQRTTGTQKSDQWLYMVIIYLLVFKVDEMGYHTFASLVRSCPPLPMYLLLDFLFNEEALSSAARRDWLGHYDAAYVDQVLMPQIQKHAEPLSGLVESLRNLSMASATGASHGTKSDPLVRGEPSCTQKNISEKGKLSRLLADYGYADDAKQVSTAARPNREFQLSSYSENVARPQTGSSETSPAILERSNPHVLLVPSDEKKPANSASLLPYPNQTTRRGYENEMNTAKALGSTEMKGIGSDQLEGAGSANRHQQPSNGHDDVGGYSLSQSGTSSHSADSNEPLKEKEKASLLQAEGEEAILEESKEAEKEEDEEEEEDLWLKDIDGEETFVDRKTEREKQKVVKQQAVFRQWTMQRPSNLQKLVDEAEARFRSECTFRPITPQKMPVFNKAEAPVKLTTAEVLRADALLRKRQNEDYKLIKQFEIDKRDAREFTEWQQKERKKQEEQRIKNVAIKRAEAQLARAQGIHAAALLRRSKARSVRSLRENALDRQMLRREQRAQEHAQLVERARAAREARHTSVEAAKQASETRRQHAAEEKLKRTKEQALTLRLAAEERTSKRSVVVRVRGLEQAAVKTRGLLSRVGRRDDWNETNGAALPTVNGMPLAEVKARLEMKKAQERERLQRKSLEILDQKLKREEKLAARVEEIRRSVAMPVLEELRTQQIKNEFLHSTKLNMEQQVQEQQMNGAERRAESRAKQGMQKDALTEGIKRRERYQRMANKAIAEVKEAARNIERAGCLLTLRQQQRDLQILFEAARTRRAEERLLSERIQQVWRQPMQSLSNTSGAACMK